jgi:hypothetical protein
MRVRFYLGDRLHGRRLVRSPHRRQRHRHENPRRVPGRRKWPVGQDLNRSYTAGPTGWDGFVFAIRDLATSRSRPPSPRPSPTPWPTRPSARSPGWSKSPRNGATTSDQLPEQSISRDQMPTVMLYWLTGTAGSPQVSSRTSRGVAPGPGRSPAPGIRDRPSEGKVGSGRATRL